MSFELLQNLWYFVICISIVCYTTLDGFDLGVGCLHLFAKKDADRRVFLNAIGPVWDGNAVWIVIVGGALFAGFPEVYATLFSGFYTLTMILLCGFIFRAVAIEFRSKKPSKLWRMTWDFFFGIASIVIAFGIGVILGNLILGIPLDEMKNYTGTFMDLLRPYPVLVGIFSVSLLSMHGALYLFFKTEGELHKKLREWIYPTMIFFIITFILVTFSTLTFTDHMIQRMETYPILFIIPILVLISIVGIPFFVHKKRDGVAFISSCILIALLFSLFGIGTYPYIILSSVDPELFSLTLYNASSSPTTLKVLLLIAAIGVPLVLAYGFYIYRVFRGKVKIDPTSY